MTTNNYHGVAPGEQHILKTAAGTVLVYAAPDGTVYVDVNDQGGPTHIVCVNDRNVSE